MLRLLDKLWFTIKDRASGYHLGYEDGVRAGLDIKQASIESRLNEYNPQLSDQSFQLGYAHAVEVVKGKVGNE
jgi:hypothetical protein